jgi:CubicO group peptidase (beta-lactamase class C family)
VSERSDQLARAGLSGERLDRLDRFVASQVETGEMPGVITLVERRGMTFVGVHGFADRERRRPLERTSIFRVASMTKPITAVAAMILVEEAAIRLDDSVERWLPELAKPQVLVDSGGDLRRVREARRPITVRDCLTYRTGHIPAMGPPATPLEQAIADQELFGIKPLTPHGHDEWIRRLGTLPLASEPGERWSYHVGSEILGILLSRASGLPLPQFMRSRVFEPLGMTDTGFEVAGSARSRLTSCYLRNFTSGEVEEINGPADPDWGHAPAFISGGAGLYSTLDDYLAFARMMLAGGAFPGGRILSRPTLEMMTTNQLTVDQMRTAGMSPIGWRGRGWGLGVGVVLERLAPSLSPGSFGWDGAFGTQWWADPREDMTVLVMTQLGNGPGATFGGDVLALAYGAIDD